MFDFLYTVIRGCQVSAKLGTCAVVGRKEHLLKLKCSHSPLYVHILSSASVLFGPTTVQRPNLALVETKRITVYSVVYSVHKTAGSNTEPYTNECKVLCNIACRSPWFDTGQPSGPFLVLNFKCLYREIENRCKT
jgi:hypothetical protein